MVNYYLNRSFKRCFGSSELQAVIVEFQDSTLLRAQWAWQRRTLTNSRHERMKRGLSTGDITTAALHDCDVDDGHGVFTQTRGQRKRSKKRDVNAIKTKQPAEVTPTSEAAMSQQIFSSTITPASAVVGNGHSVIADEQSEVHESMLVSGLKKEVD